MSGRVSELSAGGCMQGARAHAPMQISRMDADVPSITVAASAPPPLRLALSRAAESQPAARALARAARVGRARLQAERIASELYVRAHTVGSLRRARGGETF